MSKNPGPKGWKMLKVSTVDNRFEEDIVSQALEKEGIPFLIRRYSDTAYDGLFIPQKGWAAVMVPKDFVERAKAVIGDLRKDFKIEEWEAKRQRSGVRSQEPKSQEKESETKRQKSGVRNQESE